MVKNNRGRNPDGKYYLFYAHHDPRSGIGVAVSEKRFGTHERTFRAGGGGGEMGSSGRSTAPGRWRAQTI